MNPVRMAVFVCVNGANLILIGIGLVNWFLAINRCGDAPNTGVFKMADSCAALATAFHLALWGVPAIGLGVLALLLRPASIVVVRDTMPARDLPVRNAPIKN